MILDALYSITTRHSWHLSAWICTGSSDWWCICGLCSCIPDKTYSMYMNRFFIRAALFSLPLLHFSILLFATSSIFLFHACFRILSFLPLFPHYLWMPLSLWIPSNPFGRWERMNAPLLSWAMDTWLFWHCSVFISHCSVLYMRTIEGINITYVCMHCSAASPTLALHPSLLHLSLQANTLFYYSGTK